MPVFAKHTAGRRRLKRMELRVRTGPRYTMGEGQTRTPEMSPMPWPRSREALPCHLMQIVFANYG
jgi:hypothetical protein